MTKVRLAAWHTAVFSALGLHAMSGCGGQSVQEGDSNANQSGDGSGGTTGGSVPGTGGSVPGTGGSGGDFQHCDRPTPYFVYSLPEGGQGGDSGEPTTTTTGFWRCGDGWLHRAERVECPSMLPRPGLVQAAVGECRTDADCTAAREGRCEVSPAGVGPCGPAQPTAYCAYGCTRDEDCAEGSICFCDNPTGRCVAASCTTDADCNGYYCASNGPPETTAFTCQTPRDTCMTPADCPVPDPGLIMICATAAERYCLPQQGVGGSCGRPFLVAGMARLAPLRAGDGDWAQHMAPETCGAVAARQKLAEHWAEMGRMEHASVAAFARFTLDLLSLGAPAELVAASQQALGDEIEHARLCFGLASAYAGRALGPGELSVDGALEARSFETIVKTAIHEACVGETLAALEAEAELAAATDPEVRRVLQRIARDEARHAELGYRFLRWALDRAEPDLRQRLVAELDGALRAELARKPASGSLLREIVEPAVRALDQAVRRAA
jgi:hypothetical protein